MKANEAPERIWIDPATDLSKLSGHIDKDSVEYIRKDAFIEDACAWLKENGGSYWMDDYDLPTDDLVNDFRKYMKGENE